MPAPSRLSENGLYTVEAWRIFLERLTPQGVFTVSRWYAPGEVNETGRMVSLAVATLLDLGVADPRRHLFVAARRSVATLVVSRVAAVRRRRSPRSQRRAQPTTSHPARARQPGRLAVARRHRLGAGSRGAAKRRPTAPISTSAPPTDARPFFFNQLRLGRLFGQDLLDSQRPHGVFSGNLLATLTLGMLILISAVLVLATIVVPLRSTVRSAPADAGARRHRLLRADRHRLHDDRDRRSCSA